MQSRLDLEKSALGVIKSRYLLCILVSQRIHQLEKGAKSYVNTNDEPVSPKNFYELALKEINEGNMDLEQIAG
ncbi:MAG: DNA-directed RNA polymerase subunit omega [Nitrospinae bacterium]|nr:DNA-directed RNA polymerase subunit omega [Nitrospinota bacterium]